MGRDMATESWFSSLWRNSRKSSPEPDKAVVGVLAFEVASLMTKVINLWNSLSDKEIFHKVDEVLSSVGVRKLVGDNDDFLMDLVLNEVMHNYGVIATSVARLARKCTEAPFLHFERFVKDPVKHHVEWLGWEYRLKKMERQIKKMERFIAITMQLTQELEVLAELEQTLRRMQANPDAHRKNLYGCQQRVLWQRQEVKNLREMSPWNRSYDYVVRLFARSLLTILERIKLIFENKQLPSAERNNHHKETTAAYLSRSRSVSAVMQSSIHPSEVVLCGLSSGPPAGSGSISGLVAEKNKTYNKQQNLHASSLQQKHSQCKPKRLAGPFKGCVESGSDSPIFLGCKPVGGSMRFPGNPLEIVDEMEKLDKGSFPSSNAIYSKLVLYGSKCSLLDAPSSSLGNAALALHYANVIVLIEELISSPHSVDFETRDDLYDMLPASIRAALRAKLKVYSNSLTQSVYDASLAEEWSLALSRILKWLSPLAHNMIRWHAERNFEKEHEVSRPNVLLVQTLHYANQEKTEAAITELLVGLNYICRINRELNEKGLPEFSVTRTKFCYGLKRTNGQAYNGE